jgi:hypothetical protein
VLVSTCVAATTTCRLLVDVPPLRAGSVTFFSAQAVADVVCAAAGPPRAEADWVASELTTASAFRSVGAEVVISALKAWRSALVCRRECDSSWAGSLCSVYRADQTWVMANNVPYLMSV